MVTLRRSPFVLVTGGAGGIGSALCRLLPKVGFLPIIAYHRNEKAANSLVRESGGIALKIDLGDDESISNGVEFIASFENSARFLAGVVLCASPPPNLLPFTQISSKILFDQFHINVVGHHLLLAGLIKNCFRKNKTGVVVGVLTKALGSNIDSPATGMGAYVIAKGSLAHMLSVCAAEYLWLKVRTISPGFTETRMLDVFDSRYLELARNQEKFSSPEKIAELIIKEIVHE